MLVEFGKRMFPCMSLKYKYLSVMDNSTKSPATLVKKKQNNRVHAHSIMLYMPKDIEVLLDSFGLIMNREVEYGHCMHASIFPVVTNSIATVPSFLDVNVAFESCLVDTTNDAIVDHIVGINSNTGIVLAITKSELILLDYNGAPSFGLLEPNEEDPIENNVGLVNNISTISIHKSLIDTGLSIVDKTPITIACKNCTAISALESPYSIVVAINSRVVWVSYFCDINWYQ